MIEEMSKIKNITLRVSDDFHYSAKSFATKQRISLQDYMVTTIEDDLISKKAFVKSPDTIAKLLGGFSDEEFIEVVTRMREERQNKK